MSSASSPSSELPLAIWPSAQRSRSQQRQSLYVAGSDRPGELRPDVARRAIEVYSDPGDLVIDPLCGDGTTLVEAVRQERTAIGVESDERRLAIAQANVRAASRLHRAGRAYVASGTLDALPRLLATPAARRVRRPRSGKVVQLPYGSADLVLASAARRPRLTSAQLVELCRQSARVVKPGGFVVVVARAQRQRANVAAETVSIAESVGLPFWQHVIALLVPIKTSQLAAEKRETVLAELDRTCHEDVLIFRRPAQAAAAACVAAPATNCAGGGRR